MDFILSRYRNLTLLLAVIAVQLLLVAYQVKSNQDIRLIRVWSVNGITTIAKVVEGVRAGTIGFFHDYFILLNAREENRRLKDEVAKLKLDNQYLRTELSTADRAKAMEAFTTRSASRTIGTRIIANSTGANSKVVFVDRGSKDGVQRGMAVVTPDGIAGKVVAVFGTASQVMLISDPSFAAGVMSEKYHVRGTLKGQGHGTLLADYVPNDLKVEVGEKFYTSGDDRIFPKGMPVGEVKSFQPGRSYKQIFITPYAFRTSLEEMFIVLDGVHQPLPKDENLTYHMQPAASGQQAAGLASPTGALTDADRVRQKYKKPAAAPGLFDNTVQAAPQPHRP